MYSVLRRVAAATTILAAAVTASAQLRVATWNISNYGGGRELALRNAIFGTFEGRTMTPDVILTQEFLSQSAVNAFLAMLNGTPGMTNKWGTATFLNGPDTDSAFFYRTDKVQLLGVVTVLNGGSDPLPPRDVRRYDIKLLGYPTGDHRLSLYSSHMKSGNTSSDEARRLAEATAIRNDAQDLLTPFLIGGDFNTPSSSDPGFAQLTANLGNNVGRFYDPISSSGSWQNNFDYRFVHTQDPTSSAGMDDRYDFILLSGFLVDGNGFDYIGNPLQPYSTSTWNDPNHSYRCWGNDGGSFNLPMSISNNQMVGPVIAQGLAESCGNSGHLPIFLDLRVPAELAVTETNIDFGIIVQGSNPSSPVTVFNATDPAMWGSGVANLSYTLSANGGFLAPGGTFADPAGGGANTHQIGIDTSTPGQKSGLLTVSSTVSGITTTRTVTLSANVIPSTIGPATITTILGTTLGGGLPQVQTSNDDYYVVRSETPTNTLRTPLVIEATTTSPLANPSTITVGVEASCDVSSSTQEIFLFNFGTGKFERLHLIRATDGDQTVTFTVGSNPARFISPNGTMRLKLSYTTTSNRPRQGIGRVDRIWWSVAP